MKKITFLLKRFRFKSLKTLIYIRNKVKKNSKKKFILFDMIFCLIKYQAAFSDYLEFEFYNLNKKQRKTYLTNGKNNEIVKKFNNHKYFHVLENKNEFNEYFKNYIKRDYLNPNSTKEAFKNFIKNKNRIIIKPINGIGGFGIKIMNTKDTQLYELSKTYLLEEIILQHDKLNELYNKSVNSIRIFTFFDGKNSHFLQAVLKIGNNNIVDNFSNGGMYAFLNEKGIVITPAIDKNDKTYISHPISNKKIIGFEVPFFEEAKKITLKASKEMPQIKYIGWDVAIKQDGPCIIEGNSYPGVFQIKPRFNKEKTGILPKYEKIMKIKF